MIPTVSLRAVAQEMDVFSDEEFAYLNPQSGELVTIRREEIAMVESGDDLENYPDWQRALIQETQEVLQSQDYLPLPSKFDIHEYAILERFCYSVEDDALSQELLDQIRGSGAFRRFKDTLHRLGIIDDWYRYRQAALEDIAEDWLKQNHIPYTREA
jgi:hypothetical protein